MAESSHDNALGDYLRARRSQMNPGEFGFSATRRRTPGLRREEVALLANVSPAWYTWLEQGRQGTPSADVLDRLARGLRLSDPEREHLYLLAQNRPPEVEPPEPEDIGPELPTVLEAFTAGPAFLRNSAWDLLAINASARRLWGPVSLDSPRFNILERYFAGEFPIGASAGQPRSSVARVLVAQFRAEAFQTGFGPRARHVVEGLVRVSPEFRQLWSHREVGLPYEPLKTLVLPGHQELTFHVAKLSVDGRPGLKLVLMTPTQPLPPGFRTDFERIF